MIKNVHFDIDIYMCYRIGIPALEKYHIFWWVRCLVFLDGEINIIFTSYPLKGFDIAVRHFDRRNSHAFANQLFHRSFTMRFLCFLPAVVQIHLHSSLQDVGIQFSGLNYKSDCFLRYFLLHKYLRSAFPCAYAPLRWNIQPM